MNLQPDRKAWFEGGEARCHIPPLPCQRTYRIVLMGPPGVGKGTQAELLCQNLGTCHLSTGDLIRSLQCQSEPSPAARTALEAMGRGQLVSDSVIVSLVKERAECLRCQGGFLLDGFPRTVAQAMALDNLLAEKGVALDCVLCYNLPLEEVVARLSGRRTCSACKAIYHATTRPPRVVGICDKCGGRLVQRQDDRPESIRVRMRAYEESTQPLVDYYACNGSLLPIQASGTPEEIFERTCLEMKKRLPINSKERGLFAG